MLDLRFSAKLYLTFMFGMVQCKLILDIYVDFVFMHCRKLHFENLLYYFFELFVRIIHILFTKCLNLALLSEFGNRKGPGPHMSRRNIQNIVYPANKKHCSGLLKT